MFYLDAKSTNEFFGGPKSVEICCWKCEEMLWGRKKKNKHVCGGTRWWRDAQNMTDMTPSFIHRNCRPKHWKLLKHYFLQKVHENLMIKLHKLEVLHFPSQLVAESAAANCFFLMFFGTFELQWCFDTTDCSGWKSKALWNCVKALFNIESLLVGRLLCHLLYRFLSLLYMVCGSLYPVWICCILHTSSSGHLNIPEWMQKSTKSIWLARMSSLCTVPCLFWGWNLATRNQRAACPKNIHPGRLTWNLQITNLERKMIFQTSMMMFHVNLQWCWLNICEANIFDTITSISSRWMVIAIAKKTCCIGGVHIYTPANQQLPSENRPHPKMKFHLPTSDFQGWVFTVTAKTTSTLKPTVDAMDRWFISSGFFNPWI